MGGLHVSPDLDTALYTLAGLSNPQMGWGIQDDTFGALDLLVRYGYPDWFHVGDHDLATHIARTDLLRQGKTLTEVTAHLATSLAVHARLLPMCNEPVETLVHTPTEILPFQDYFVRRRAADPVTSVEMRGIAEARVTARGARCSVGGIRGCAVFVKSDRQHRSYPGRAGDARSPERPERAAHRGEPYCRR